MTVFKKFVGTNKSPDPKGKWMSLIFAIIFFPGCQRSVKDRIISYFENYCEKKEDTCILMLNNLLPFEWDTMFIFGANADQNFIEATIQSSYRETAILRGVRKIIFTYDQQIVHEEAYETPYLSESSIDFSCVKDSILNLRSYSFHVNEAIFYVQKEKIPNGYRDCFIYHLLTVNSN